uniref:GH18 domain-containing protein n=1 Tax=Leersia perrieri TaxID=77586 RepID=A0A0D9X1U7_9ORYZ
MALSRLGQVIIAAAASALLLLPFLAGPAAAAGQTGQVTVFWGRNINEGSLREACDTAMYTMVIISFLNVSVHGHSGDYSLDLSGHPLAGVGADIKHCQRKGVLVSLSLSLSIAGGALPGDQSAIDLADHLSNTYLAAARDDATTAARPFGDAVLDGVDFFFHDAATPADAERYGVLATELSRSRNAGDQSSPPPRLTATAPCAFPAGAAALATSAFERVHVRFYGGENSNCTVYWEDAWARWTAAYPRSRVYFGLPAAPAPEKDGGGGGYIYPKTLYYSYVPELQKAANYGGFMIWDHYSDKKSGYSAYVKNWA